MAHPHGQLYYGHGGFVAHHPGAYPMMLHHNHGFPTPARSVAGPAAAQATPAQPAGRPASTPSATKEDKTPTSASTAPTDQSTVPGAGAVEKVEAAGASDPVLAAKEALAKALLLTDRLQLFSLGTPNGWKVGIMLEELGIPYDAHTVDIRSGEQFAPSFKAVNPNCKIPAIVDPKGPNGKPMSLSESGAILLYLAEKHGKFIPSDPALKWEVVQWLFFQMAGVGPMFGQFGHFSMYAPEKIPYAIDRYTKETKRLLSVLEERLAGRNFLVGDSLTIADIATAPWVVCLDKFYKAGEVLNLAQYPSVNGWVKRFLERPGVARGMAVTPFPAK